MTRKMSPRTDATVMTEIESGLLSKNDFGCVVDKSELPVCDAPGAKAVEMTVDGPALTGKLGFVDPLSGV